jgi:hypothetical protein
VRTGTGISLEAEGPVNRGYMAFRCRLQEVILHNGRNNGVKVRMSQEDTGIISTAFDRDCEFTIPGNKGLAGTAVLVFNLIRSQSPDAFGGSRCAGAGKEDNLAFVTFPLSPADTLKRNPGMPYGFEHGRIQGYRNERVHGMEKYTDGLRHTLPRNGRDREILTAGCWT